MWGIPGLVLVLLCSTKCPFQFCNHLAGEENDAILFLLCHISSYPRTSESLVIKINKNAVAGPSVAQFEVFFSSGNM